MVPETEWERSDSCHLHALDVWNCRCVFFHVAAECNLTAPKVKPIDGVDPEEIEKIAVPKS